MDFEYPISMPVQLTTSGNGGIRAHYWYTGYII